LGKKYHIIVDTREKPSHAWHFAPSSWCAGSVSRKLDQGDYAVEGLESVVVVDRKASPSELAGNLTDDRFARELARLSDLVEYPVIVCEFSHAALEAFPEGSDIPRSRRRFVKVKGPFLLRLLTERMIQYPKVHWAFFESPERAREFTRALFKRVVETIEANSREAT
jgi:hypothetical protein